MKHDLSSVGPASRRSGLARRRSHQSCSRRAFTLIEMLVVMGALGVCLFLGTTLIVTSLKADRLGTTAANRVSERLELARQFRDDAHQANAAPDQLGDIEAGPTVLILQRSDKSAVVYRWADDKLERTVRVGETETKQFLPAGPEKTRVEFVRAAGVVTLRVVTAKDHGPAAEAEIAAAVGGDLR